MKLRLSKRVAIVTAASVALAGLLAVPALVAVASTPAADVVPVDGSPRPVNVLPSTVKGALPVTGGTGAHQYLAVQLYRMSRTPAFWAAVQQMNAGTATSTQIELVKKDNGTWSVPATKTANFTKTVGGVATALSGYSMGAAIGAGTLDLVGFDAQGTVCSSATGVAQAALSLLTGQDCSSWDQMLDSFVPNTDVLLHPAGVLWATNNIVNSAGQTLKVCSISSVVVDGSSLSIQCSMEANAYGTTTNDTWSVECINPSTGQITSVGRNTLLVAVGGVMTYSYACAAGWEPYAAGASRVVTQPGAGTFVRDGSRSVWWRHQYIAGHTIDGWAWFSGYSPNHSAEPSADPLRTLRCVITTTTGTLTRDSPTFRESEGVLPQVQCPDIEGLTVTSFEVQQVNLDDGSWGTLWSQGTTPEFQGAQALAPECGQGTCMLDLRREGASCFQAPGSCEGWFADPNKGSKYSCHYGTHAVDLAECTIYAPTFQPGATTTGNTYGDPSTGAPLPNPDGSTGSDPSGAGRNCFTAGWGSANPVEWVFRPVQCALEWAFVPRAEVVHQVGAQVSTSWDGTIFAQAPTIVGAWTASLPDDVGGCKGPPINLNAALSPLGVPDTGTHYPLSACEAPFDWLASIANIFLSGTVAISGAFAFVRYIAATFGFPGFGKGGDLA